MEKKTEKKTKTLDSTSQEVYNKQIIPVNFNKNKV